MYLESLAGGALIGLAAALLLLTNGRIMGISGIAGSTLGLIFSPGKNPQFKREVTWRLAFLLGLFFAGLWIASQTQWLSHTELPLNHPLIWVVSGLLVGVGTRVGWGCTSGHGICGLGRLSGRSLVATCIFMGAGMGTVVLAKMIFSGMVTQ